MSYNGYYDLNKIQKENNFKKHQKEKFYKQNKFFAFKKITEERKEEIKQKAFLYSDINNEKYGSDKLYQIYTFLNNESQNEMQKLCQMMNHFYF